MVQILSPVAPSQTPESTAPETPAVKLSSKLRTRPPTPPRESARETSSPQEPSINPHPEVLETPTSTAESINRTKKQVNWSPWTKYHKPDDPSPLRPSRPNSALSTPLKSILKPFNPSIIPIGLLNSSGQLKAYSYDSFPAMLESITQALASTERSKKLDTYVTFSNTLKAYDDKPDLKAIKNKMPLLSSFIRRDLGAKLPNSANNSYDSQLIQQAIKLLTIFVWIPQLAETIDDEDAVYFIQHAIQVIKDSQSPKVLVTYFLHFLAQQRFPPKIITPDRANAMINALINIEDRVAGNTVIMERISVYQKLLIQCNAVMITRTSDWMENLLGAILSSNKELRIRAVGCMTEAARTVGAEKNVARSVSNLLNREEDSVKMFERVSDRLSYFIRNGEGAHAAQVWGLVVLLLRGRPPVSSWEHFNTWLNVIQQCFNSSTITTKIAANAAWSKLIYVMHCSPEVTIKNMDLLTRPLVRYLDPQNASSNSKGPRQAALSNVCTLLYYNIRPNIPAKHLSLTWDFVVVALIEKLVLFGKQEVEDGCRILAALFDGSHLKAWNELRGLEKEAIKAEEIIRLDPKWVRLNSELVLKTLEIAIRRSSWERTDCAVRLLWRKFTKTLADASMKEVKISAETMETVAHIFNMLQRFWREGPAAFPDVHNISSDDFMAILTFLVITTFESIGIFCFTEKELSYDEQNKFAAISTPSNRYSSEGDYEAIFLPPIVYLFQLFLKPFDGADFSEQYFDSAKTILGKCLEAQDSRRKRLAILSACTTILPQRGSSTVDREAWAIIAMLAETALLMKEKLLSSPTPVSGEFKDVLKILQWGCRYDISAWSSLFDAFAQTVTVEQGDAQLISTVIEPLAEYLRLENLDYTRLTHGKTILDKAVYPRTQTVTETVARVPYGIQSWKHINIENYDNLYSMINRFLITSYPECEDTATANAIKEFIAALIDLMHRCPKNSTLILLQRIQEGVAVWIMDQKELLSKKNSDLVSKIQTLWTCITEAISKLPRHDSMILQALTTLVACGLESKRKATVNSTIKTWNATFGSQNVIEYPARVRILMKKLRPIADITLPTFPEDIDEIVPTPPVWGDSQESQEEIVLDRALWSSPTPAPSHNRNRAASPMTLESMSTSSRSFLTRLREASSRLASSKPKPQLKHMDSQLEFAPIDAEGSANSMIDSQLLTEHQKEVRERQYEEAAILFPTINVDQPRKNREGRQSLKESEREPRLQQELAHGTLLERSPSPDEFVDAPEESIQAKPDDIDEDCIQEVDFVPSTAFVIQVPTRTKEINDSLGSDGHEPSDEELSIEQMQHDHESEDKPIELSKYMSLPKTGIESRNEDEASTMENANDSSEPIPVTTQGSKLLGLLVGTKDADKVDIPDSTEAGRLSPCPAELARASKNDQSSRSGGQQESIVEVPDSFILEVGESMGHVRSEEHSQEEQSLLGPKATSGIENQMEDLEQKDAPEIDERAPKKAKKPSGGRRRKSVNLRTTTPKSHSQDEEPMLDCIMVTPATPTKTFVQAGLPNTTESLQASSNPDSPIPSSPLMNAKKRKQRNISLGGTSEPRTVDRAPKRRATRVPKPASVERDAGDTSQVEGPVAEPIAQTKSPTKPPNVDSPASTPRQSRALRRRLAEQESIIMDSQPEVMGTAERGMQSIIPHKEEDVSVVTDSAEGSSQVESIPQPEQESEQISAREISKSPLDLFKEALSVLEVADLGPTEAREAEDLVFDVYLRLREKRRKR